MLTPAVPASSARATAGATVTRGVLDEISGPTGRPAWIRVIPITSDNICHIKSNGVGADSYCLTYERKPFPQPIGFGHFHDLF